MIFGVDYYPEHWDKEEWQKQAELMKKAGFNTVRMAEFSWSRLEPRENEFDFEWLDEIIELLGRMGIKTVLGTPTAAPPKWLFNKYDIVMRDRYGRERSFGSRRSCCANSPEYIERSRIITEKLSEHYGKNPYIRAWQIDNEFGCHDSTRCYCANCRRKFAEWTKKKYGDIRELNKKYGTVFWSQEYSSFDDIILPAYTSCEGEEHFNRSHNPSLEMDYYRFASDSWIEFAKMQTDIIRKYSDFPITHNLMGHFSDIDYYKLAKNLDFVSWDNYVDNQWSIESYEKTSMAHELMRGAKDKSFWVMEEQSGPCGWDVFGGTPRPGQIRLWTYQAAAHGADGILYFRFRSAPFGMEQYWLGVIDHDGIPRRRYYEISRTAAELQRLSSLIENSYSETDVLIVKSYEDTWSHSIKGHVRGFDYLDILLEYYTANNHIGTDPDCGCADMISEIYKAVYMPACAIIDEKTENILKEYVRSGGTLVLTYRSGIRDDMNNIITQTMPGRLRELAGLTVEEFDSSPVETALSDGFGTACQWRDIVKTEGAEPVVCYKSEYYAGTPAVTVNNYGKGSVWYIACDMEAAGLERIVKMISDSAGVSYLAHPEGTEALQRCAGSRRYIMLLNYTEKEKDMGLKGISLINGNTFDGVLEPYGVECITNPELDT